MHTIFLGCIRVKFRFILMPSDTPQSQRQSRERALINFDQFQNQKMLAAVLVNERLSAIELSLRRLLFANLGRAARPKAGADQLQSPLSQSSPIGPIPAPRE
jgi:hypothetical protein